METKRLWKAHGLVPSLAFKDAPRAVEWCGRIYRARDLEGHQWEFSQRDVDLDAAEWRLPPGLKRGTEA